MKTRLKVDASATLAHYPMSLTPATSATVTIYEPGGSVLVATQAAAVEAIDTTCAASAARGASKFELVTGVGVVAGNKYALCAFGKWFAVEVKQVVVSDIYIFGRLPFAVDQHTTFKGYRLSVSLTPTTKADNYRASWSITYSTGVVVEESLFDVVAAKDYYPTTLSDVVARYPRVANLLQRDDTDGQQLLRTAWDSMLVPQLAAKGLRIERVRDYQWLIPLHMAYVNELVAEHDAMIDRDKLEQYQVAKNNCDEVLALISTDVDWYDTDDDLASADDEQHVNRRGFTVTR